MYKGDKDMINDRLIRILLLRELMKDNYNELEIKQGYQPIIEDDEVNDNPPNTVSSVQYR